MCLQFKIRQLSLGTIDEKRLQNQRFHESGAKLCFPSFFQNNFNIKMIPKIFSIIGFNDLPHFIDQKVCW